MSDRFGSGGSQVLSPFKAIAFTSVRIPASGLRVLVVLLHTCRALFGGRQNGVHVAVVRHAAVGSRSSSTSSRVPNLVARVTFLYKVRYGND